MRLRDECQTTFKTKTVFYELIVMPFGFSNAPGTFMSLMNHAFKPLIGKFMIVCFDDILIHSKMQVEHLEHLRQILQVLREQRLRANLKKCHFCTSNLVFIGYIVSEDHNKVDLSKVEASESWPVPSSLNGMKIRYAYGIFLSSFFFFC